MKTVITLTIVHSKPLPDITDVICQRVWPYGGGCITDMTAAIQEKSPAGMRHACNLWVEPVSRRFVVDHCDHPLDELIPAYTHIKAGRAQS